MDKFKKNLLKDETGKQLKSTTNFEETLERFNKKKSKDLTVNDLQLEITVVKQELIILKIDKSLDHQQIDNDKDEHKDGEESNHIYIYILWEYFSQQQDFL